MLLACLYICIYINSFHNPNMVNHHAKDKKRFKFSQSKLCPAMHKWQMPASASSFDFWAPLGARLYDRSRFPDVTCKAGMVHCFMNLPHLLETD